MLPPESPSHRKRPPDWHLESLDALDPELTPVEQDSQRDLHWVEVEELGILIRGDDDPDLFVGLHGEPEDGEALRVDLTRLEGRGLESLNIGLRSVKRSPVVSRELNSRGLR